MTKDLIQRVEAYLERTKKGRGAKSFPLTKRSVFEVYCGTKNEWGGHEPVAIYRGKFIDVVAKLVTRQDFEGFYTSATMASESNGYVKEYAPKITDVPKVEGLLETIAHKQRYEKAIENIKRSI